MRCALVLLTNFVLCSSHGTNVVEIVIEGKAAWNNSSLWGKFVLKYLNREIGNENNLTFQMLSNVDSKSMEALISNKSAQFLFGSTETCACDSARYNAAPLLTARPGTNGKVDADLSGVLVAHINNSKIESVQDLKGAKIGCSKLDDFQTTLLTKYIMLKVGLDIYKDAKMITSSAPLRVMTDNVILDLIAHGNLDVGLIHAGALATYPTGMLKIIPTSAFTESIPAGCVLAFPHVDPALKLAVLNVLTHVDPFHAALAPAGYSAWDVAFDYSDVRTILGAAGALGPDPTTLAPICRLDDPNWQYYEVATCPTGYYKVPEAQATQNCQDLNLTCPAPACWCGICAPGPPIRVFVAAAGPPAAPGNSSACLRMQPCAAARQREAVLVTLIDGLRRAGLNVTVSLGPLDPPPASLQAAAALLPAASQPWNYSVAVTASAAGYSLLRIFVDGAEVDETPTVLRILPALCHEGCAILAPHPTPPHPRFHTHTHPLPPLPRARAYFCGEALELDTAHLQVPRRKEVKRVGQGAPPPPPLGRPFGALASARLRSLASYEKTRASAGGRPAR